MIAEKPSINMVPFIDIMLVLLTIVLTTSTFIASGRIPINLPHASHDQQTTTHTHVIEINAAGKIFLDGTPLDDQGLKSRLAPLARSTPLMVRADRSLPLQRFVDVADLLKQLGFAKVAIQTETAGA
jgi:biopolymer transport protein ExbD